MMRRNVHSDGGVMGKARMVAAVSNANQLSLINVLSQ